MKSQARSFAFAIALLSAMSSGTIEAAEAAQTIAAPRFEFSRPPHSPTPILVLTVSGGRARKQISSIRKFRGYCEPTSFDISAAIRVGATSRSVCFARAVSGTNVARAGYSHQ